MSQDNPGMGKFMGMMNQGTGSSGNPMRDAANMRQPPPLRPATHDRNVMDDMPLPRYEENDHPGKKCRDRVTLVIY